MRTITKQQKLILDKFFNVGISIYDEIPLEQQINLEKMNDNELFYQQATQYLMDKAIEKNYNI